MAEKQDFNRKFDHWLLHQLTTVQLDRGIATCDYLLYKHKNESVLARIVAGGEKWVMYQDVKCQSTLLTPCFVIEIKTSSQEAFVEYVVYCSGKDSLVKQNAVRIGREKGTLYQLLDC